MPDVASNSAAAICRRMSLTNGGIRVPAARRPRRLHSENQQMKAHPRMAIRTRIPGWSVSGDDELTASIKSRRQTCSRRTQSGQGKRAEGLDGNQVGRAQRLLTAPQLRDKMDQQRAMRKPTNDPCRLPPTHVRRILGANIRRPVAWWIVQPFVRVGRQSNAGLFDRGQFHGRLGLGRLVIRNRRLGRLRNLCGEGFNSRTFETFAQCRECARMKSSADDENRPRCVPLRLTNLLGHERLRTTAIGQR